MSTSLQPCVPERPMQLFEELYGLMVLLFPGLRGGTSPGTGGPELDISVVEHSRYTTTLELHRGFGVPLIPDIAMTLRVYHDARVAEVVAYQGCDRLPPPYAMLGNLRFTKDERRQVNYLLRQILQLRLAALWDSSSPLTGI